MKRCQAALCIAAIAAIPLVVAAKKHVGVDLSFPTPLTRPGEPIERRLPELRTDRPAFQGQTRAPYRKTAGYKVTTITEQLKRPWTIAFLPDGKMLVTEKPGAMRIVDPGGAVSAPIAGVPKVFYTDQLNQVGLLDVALDPQFATSRRIFFSYNEEVGGRQTNLALARATFDEARRTLADVKVIFRAKPALPRARAANSGGRIAIGRNGAIYMTVGDRSRSPPWDVAQKLDTHLGKIIRITAEGAPAAGNPFVGKAGALPEIWTLGHRSQEGLAFAPDGQLWENEHGPRGGDELNRIEKGKNYGWPVIAHGIDYPGEKINHGKTEQAGLEQPRYYWDPVIAPSGLAFYTGKLFPQWQGSVFVGALRGRLLDRLTLKGDKIVDEEPLLVELHERIREVREGPDGALYVLTDESKLLKLTPK